MGSQVKGKSGADGWRGGEHREVASKIGVSISFAEKGLVDRWMRTPKRIVWLEAEKRLGWELVISLHDCRGGVWEIVGVGGQQGVEEETIGQLPALGIS